MANTNPAANERAMKAWVFEGPQSALVQRRVAVPRPGKGEVLVRVVASSTNPVDSYRSMWPPYPAIPGCDIAGIVESVGEGVAGFKAGDRVFNFGSIFGVYGGFGQYAILSAALAIHIPPTMSFAVAAALPVAGATAYKGLFDKLKVQKGKSIFVQGGAGGVSHFAIQLAKHAGLRVITTASGANVERLRGLKSGGPDVVVDYKNDDVHAAVMSFTNGAGVDYAFETSRDPEVITKTQRLLAYDGELASVSASVAPIQDGRYSFVQGHTYHCVMLGSSMDYSDATIARIASYTKALSELVVQGVAAPNITRVVPFAEADKALADHAAGRVYGKLIISYSANPNDVLDAAFDGKALAA